MNKAVRRIYERARIEARENNGVACILPKDVATLVRDRLKREFPGVKFMVRTSKYSGGSSVNVFWTDGPTQSQVDAVIGCYSFSRFDGMIDMQHSKTNWLTPEGAVCLAYDRGTEGSKGSHPEQIGEDPRPGWVMVRGGTDFVFTHRDMSEDYSQQLAYLTGCYWLGEDFCVPLDSSGQVEDFWVPNASEWFLVLMHRYDKEHGLSEPSSC